MVNITYDKGGITLKNGIKTFTVWIIIGVILIFVIPTVLNNTNKKLTYSELIQKIQDEEVTDIEISYDSKSASVKLKDESNNNYPRR